MNKRTLPPSAAENKPTMTTKSRLKLARLIATDPLPLQPALKSKLNQLDPH